MIMNVIVFPSSENTFICLKGFILMNNFFVYIKNEKFLWQQVKTNKYSKGYHNSLTLITKIIILRYV